MLKKIITASLFAASSLLAISLTQAADLSLAEMIVERQQSYNNLDERLGMIIDLAENEKVNWSEVDLVAGDLVEDISFIKQAFPEGSSEKSRARPRIWDNTEDFNERLTELKQSILAIKQASDNKNGRALIEAWDNADDTCNSCHRRYREFW
jgi:cytochrome c556